MKIKSFVMNKFIVYFLFLFLVSISSCKSNLEKIDINDVNAHRAYQDTLLAKDSSYEGRFVILKKLIEDYRSLYNDNLKANENYYYYLARLYNNVNYFPSRGFWIDTINNVFKRKNDYSNYNFI
jgi:hypothetical protein